MASETQARAIARSEPQSRPQAQDDYTSLCAALEASVRGRAFLAEYARRNRAADTETLLAAIDRLSAQIGGDAEALQEMRAGLRTLLTAIRLARPDIDAGRPPGKVAMLTQLVDLLERRIDGLVAGKSGADAAEAKPPLAVVPPPDEPELPIPSPTAQPPAMAVVPPAKPPVSTAIMPEVNVLDAAPPPAKPAAPKVEPLSAERLRLLAPIMALSDEERLALFS
jgi:hypothetical protein